MAVLKISQFGGESPSASSRVLPAGIARQASNLLASTGEFRPLRNDLAVATLAVSNPVSVHRLARTSAGAFSTDMSTGWIASASDINYVKGPVNDDLSERTYYTYNDGSAPPRVLDAKGTDRLMGVPAPKNAPGVSVEIVDEFTAADAYSGDTATHKEIAAAIDSSFVLSHQGNAIAPMTPGAGSVGWAPNGSGMPSTSDAYWNFLVPLVAGQMNANYTYLTRPEFGGQEVTVAGTTFFAVPIKLQAPIWTVDGPTLSSALGGIMHPTRPAEVLLDPAEISAIVASCEAYWGVTDDPQATLINAAVAATNKVGLVITQTAGGQLYTTDAYTQAYDAVVGTVSAPSGTATDRIAYQAVRMAETGDPANPEVDTYSRYWTTTSVAKANIRADIATCVSTNSVGAKSFDADRMIGLITADFETLLAQHPPGSYVDALRGSLAEVANYCVEPLRAMFTFQNLASLGGVSLSGTDNAGALLAAMAEADTALTDVTNFFESRRGQTLDAAKNAYSMSEPTVTRIVDTRFYICTYVTDWGEESAPSPVSVMTEPDQNDIVTVVAPAPPSGRNIKGIRLYRSNAGSEAAAFQYVTTLDNGPQLYFSTYTDVASAFITDNLGLTRQQYAELHYRKYGLLEGRTSPGDLALAAASVTDGYWATPANRTYVDATPSSDLQEACPSLTWVEPPAKLKGLVGMPNGILAGFDSNYVAFCDPNHPYAWPVEYQITTEHPIVGLAAFGQTLFVGTRGFPYFISGSDSASMSSLKLPTAQACVSLRSIAVMPEGVVYASPDGLCLASEAGVRCITDGSMPGSQVLWTAEDWSDNILGTSPTSLRAVSYEGSYIFFWNNGTTSGCYALGRGKLVEVALESTALYVDLVTDTLYVAKGTDIKAAFSGTGSRTATWKSGISVLPAQAPFAWAKVLSDFGSAVTVKWTADGTLRHTATFNSIEPQRLPAGRWLEHEIEISSQARVTDVMFASTTDELKGV